MLPASLLGKNLDKQFDDLGLRPYKIRFEGYKDDLIDPILIVPTPHISDLNVSDIDRPSFSNDNKRARRESDFYAIRQFSVKFNKQVLMKVAEQLDIEYKFLLTRHSKYGILKRYESSWIQVRPISEERESFSGSDFISIILQPVQGVY